MDKHYTVLPKKETCLHWLEQHGIKDKILEHSKLVNKIAVFLAKSLIAKTELIDLQLTDRASLLHDIGKVEAESAQQSHEVVGAKILDELGYPKLAVTVKHHKGDFILDNKFNGWEEVLVYYADKRVKGTNILSLDERIGKQKQKHPEKAEKLDQLLAKQKALESQIFQHLEFGTEDLKEKINNLSD